MKLRVGMIIRDPHNAPNGPYPTDEHDIVVEWIGEDGSNKVTAAGHRRNGQVATYTSFRHGDDFWIVSEPFG